MVFTTPNIAEPNIGQAFADTLANLNNLDSRLATIEALSPTALQAEIVAARGSLASVAARLIVSIAADGTIPELVAARGSVADLSTRLAQVINLDGTLKVPTWIVSPDPPLYLSANQFAVAGDRTPTYVSGLPLRATSSSGYAYSSVTTAVYSAGSALTTVTLHDPALTATLTAIAFGPIQGPKGDPGLTVVQAGGTSDAPTITAPGLYSINKPVIYVEITAGANATATPTVALNAEAPVTITARGGQPLNAGDIGPVKFVAQLSFDGAGGCELMNPLPQPIALSLPVILSQIPY